MKNRLVISLLAALIFAVDVSAQDQNTSQGRFEYFSSRMKTSKWIEGKGSFRVPDFLSQSGEEFVGDVPASVYTYWYDRVNLCYWPLLGNWATDDEDFPVKGCYVSSTAKIAKVTYRAPQKGIYSGYTDDGRIFYLKRLNTIHDVVTHAVVLVLIYPEKYQEAVQPLIKQVLNWSNPNLSI